MPRAVLFQTEDQHDSIDTLKRDRELSSDSDWFAEARLLRRDPTVSLARSILAAPIIKNAWRVEGEDKKAVEAVQRALLPLRNQIMKNSVFSGIDYGWQGYETRPHDVKGFKFLKMKLLKHELTKILISKQGFPSGITNESSFSTKEVTLRAPYFAITSSNDEYENPLGQPLLKNVKQVMDRYDEVEEAVTRHINKVAGSHWALWYPVGTSWKEGKEQDNDVIAQDILRTLKSSGKVAMPVEEADIQQMLEGAKGTGDARKSGWDLKMIESSGGIDPFLARQQYLDALKMRALLVPERTALEGHFGTKAESSEHADIAMLAIEQWGSGIVDWINSPYSFVKNVLDFNNIEYYPGAASVVPLPLADDDKKYMRETLRTILNGDPIYSRVIDLGSLGERAGVPMFKDFEERLKEAVDDVKRNDDTGIGE